MIDKPMQMEFALEAILWMYRVSNADFNDHQLFRLKFYDYMAAPHVKYPLEDIFGPIFEDLESRPCQFDRYNFIDSASILLIEERLQINHANM